MTTTVDKAGREAAGSADAFVVQTHWLIAGAGGKEKLAHRCGGLVSARTLDNWTAGNYPRTQVSGAVRELDAWARREIPGYPTAAGVPSLLDSCGRYRCAGTGATVEDAAAHRAPAPAVEPVAPTGRLRRWVRWTLAAAALVLVVAVTAFVTARVVRGDDARAAAPQTELEAATQDVVDVPLPSTGDGTVHPEVSGSIGADTFADPRTLSGGGPDIPPDTEILVRCRYYAPSVPSVSPDGFWYLIETDRWNGLWTPANSFMNGDVPGGPYVHNTDFAVPVCR